MNILRPQILRIGTRCYRKNLVRLKDCNAAEDQDYTDIPIDPGYSDEVCELENAKIENTENGYRTTISAPSALFKFVIGKKGETKIRLEKETQTKIIVPHGQEDNIVVQGHDRHGVLSAKTRIDVLLNSGRQKLPFTHFLSLPMNTQQIQGNFIDFKADVLRECDGERGLDASIFQTSAKLHLTVGCLVLLNKMEVTQAAAVLQECKVDLIDPILKKEELKIQLEGLEYMNDDPSEVDVLYAKVQDRTNRLQALVDRLVDKFTSAGLMQREHDKVKLHVTVMNTMFRRDASGTREPVRKQYGDSRKQRTSFDATQILKKFGDYKFGDLQIKNVQISQRHSVGPDGFYTCVASIDLT